MLTLHGILYVLEAHSGADMGVLLPTLADYITSLLLETTWSAVYDIVHSSVLKVVNICC